MSTKKIVLSTLAIALTAVTMTGCNEDKTTKAATTQPAAVTTSTLSSEKEKIGYALGLQIGSQLSKTKDGLDAKALIAGLNDALQEKKPKMSQEEVGAALQSFQKFAQAKAAEMMNDMATKNLAEGEAFLAANKTKEGVITLPSGLQYKVITAGTGAIPTAQDTVVTNYKGTLINGKTFDSSYERGEPATFPVSGVIAGWTEALQKMPVGSKWKLFIPAKLAYGERGAGQMIAPNATLIFDIELLEIKK